MALLLAALLQDADRIAEILSTKSLTVDFRAVPLPDAVAETLSQAGLSADVADGLLPATPVTLALRDVRARTVLRLLLKPRGFTLILGAHGLKVVRDEDAGPAARMEKYNTAELVRKLNADARSPDLSERRRRYEREAEEVGRRWRLYPQVQIPDPEIGVVSDGVVLDVRPIVLPDRRYVMLDARPLNAHLELPLPSVPIVIFNGNPGPPPESPGFGEEFLEELLQAHFGAGLPVINGDVWVRDTDAAHRRIERFLRRLAAMK